MSLLSLCKYISPDVLDRVANELVEDPIEFYCELKMFDSAISLLSNDIKSKIRLGQIYNDMHQFDLAISTLDFSASGIDEFYRLHALAIAHHYTGLDASILLEQCLVLDIPDDIKRLALPALSSYYFRKGDFTTGIRYLHVSDDSQYENTSYFDGIIRVGTDITIGYNGGIGDQIVSCRFYKHFADLGMLPIIHCVNPHLREVFENNGMRCTDTPRGMMVNIIGNVCDIPYVLGLDKNDLWYGPYLKPSLSAIEKFSNYNGIGIQWGGDKLYPFHDTRKIDIREFCDLGELYSLNIEESCDGIIDIRDKLKTIDDTLGLIYNLDYIITSDTSIGHMAAAMGKKVFIMVPMSGFYTWDCLVWYDTVTCYYQKEFAKWDYSEIKDLIREWLLA